MPIPPKPSPIDGPSPKVPPKSVSSKEAGKILRQEEMKSPSKIINATQFENLSSSGNKTGRLFAILFGKSTDISEPLADGIALSLLSNLKSALKHVPD